MSEALGHSEEAKQSAIISELHSIRTAQSSFASQIKSMAQKVESNIDDTLEIKTAIQGNPGMGHVGIVHHLEDHEKKISQLETFKIKVIAIATTISSGVGGSISWLTSHLGK